MSLINGPKRKKARQRPDRIKIRSCLLSMSLEEVQRKKRRKKPKMVKIQRVKRLMAKLTAIRRMDPLLYSILLMTESSSVSERPLILLKEKLFGL